MNRRDFLKAGALAAAGAVTSGAVTSGAVTSGAAASGTIREDGADVTGGAASPIPGRLPGSKLKLSCAAYSFRDLLRRDPPRMTLEDFVDFCARERLDATELTSYYFRRTDGEYLRSLRRRAYVNGLDISGTPVGNDFCLPPGPAREQEIHKVKEWIDRVSILGSQTIRVFAGRVPRGGDEAEARSRAVEGLEEVSEYAGERGILLALENHGGITATVDQLLDLVRRTDSPWLGVNLDTGNFHQDVYESLEKAAPHAVAVQVKARVKERNRPAEETDYRRVVSILRKSGYRGYVALEYEAGGDVLTAVREHLGKLREAIG